MLLTQGRQIFLHAAPMLIAQLAAMGMMVIDTALLGHFNTEDLAAVAVGGGIYIAVAFALIGILQAIAPTVAHLHGADRDDEIAGMLQQGFWLALLLAGPGVLVLLNPEPLFALSSIEASIESKARLYLRMLAWGMPAALLYRTFYSFCNALGKPRPLMFISLGGTVLHAMVASLLVTGWRWRFPEAEPLGVLGCGISNASVSWFSLLCAGVYLMRAKAFRRYCLFSGWQAPRLHPLRELLRLGLPMGFSNLVEISSFTLIALFVAQLGATITAGHRIVANLAAICYMFPLSLAIATLTQVGLAAGAHDWQRARAAALAGLSLAGGVSSLLGLLLWRAAEPLVSAYSTDLAVQAVALSLLVYVAIYQVFDALQTVGSYALRGHKRTFWPMLVHIGCFWGVGLFGGWWLAFKAEQPMGAAGFWMASLLGLAIAALLLAGLLRNALREHRALQNS